MRRPLLPPALALLAIAGGAAALGACQETGGTADREPTRAAASPLTRAASSTFLVAPWGEGPGELGHMVLPEAAAEGPMSLTTGPDGRVYVLDQVNRRVQVFTPEGKLDATIPNVRETAQDLAVLDDGAVVLLDRLAGRDLTFLSPEGVERARIPLEGHGVAEGGGVDGLFVDGGAVWVEVEGTTLVRLADQRGKPDPDRLAYDGRPSRKDGAIRSLTLAEGDPRAALLRRVTPAGRLLDKKSVRFELPIRHLTLLDTDARGRLFLGAHLEQRDAEDRVTEERESVVVLAPSGKRLAEVSFQASAGPEEQQKTVTVSREGVVYHLRCEPGGVEIRRWQP